MCSVNFLSVFKRPHVFLLVIPSELLRELQTLTSSKSFPYPKGEKNGHPVAIGVWPKNFLKLSPCKNTQKVSKQKIRMS